MIVFFSYRVSLATWAERGILDREVEPYRRLSPEVGGVAFLTYGAGDAALAGRLAPIRVLPRRRGMPPAVWSLLGPLLHLRELRAARVLKTNQASGAWAAVLAKWLSGRPLIVRCGFPWSFNYGQESPRAWRRGLVVLLERLAVRAADRVIVTAESVGDYLVERHGLDRARLRVVPNHVDLARFRPGPAGAREKGRVIFVGRLSPEKNLAALVRAVAQVPGARLQLVGDGVEHAGLARLAEELGTPLELSGTVPNERLGALLQRAEVFALPSRYEGQPKSLLEAMAAGLPALGSRAAGIRAVIRHGETGWLCEPEPASLAEGLRTLLGDAALRQRLGERARAEAERRFSLEATVAQELAVLRELTGP